LIERETKIFAREDLKGIQSRYVSQMLEHGIESLCCIPLTTRQGELGTLNLASKQANAFAPPDIGFLEQVAGQVAVALDNARSYREIAQLTDKLANEKLYLEEEIRSERNFEGVCGRGRLARGHTTSPTCIFRGRRVHAGAWFERGSQEFQSASCRPFAIDRNS